MYREHFLGAEFIGLVVYADDAGLATTERQRAMARLTRSRLRTRRSARPRSASKWSTNSWRPGLT